jgi:phosphoribosylformylglycinamidine cyclo-ligase
VPEQVSPDNSALTYARAGVDIDAGERAVELIRPMVASTRRPEVLGGIGGFGGLFAVPAGYRQPVLVASTDGVGTKLELARAAGRVGTIGIDLVAMCVDDLVCQGAEPLFFLDYVAVGVLDPAQMAEIVSGVAAGCRTAGCTLLGGEMAEHPGVMAPGSFDVAGFAVGIAERDRVVDGSTAAPGDVLIGLRSPGLRSNGFSLVRAILERTGAALDGPAWDGADRTLADELLVPSVIYAPAVLGVLREVDLRAAAHITGGGIPGNVPRVLPPGTEAVVDRRAWEPPRIMTELVRRGGVADEESLHVFNQGLGMVLCVPPSDASRAVEILSRQGVAAAVVGELVAAERGAAPSARFVGRGPK